MTERHACDGDGDCLICGADVPAAAEGARRRRESLERMQQEGQAAGLYEATAGGPPGAVL